MKAISVRQPWAWAIIHGGKNIENRSRRTHCRGPVLIHASKRYDLEAHVWLRSNRQRLGLPEIPPLSLLPVGGIVGRARIARCVRKSKNKWFFGFWGYVLEGIKPVEFFPLRGQLGIWETHLDIIKREGRLICEY